MMSVNPIRASVIVGLEVHPDLANATTRKEHFALWAAATERARDEFEHWLEREDASALVTPPRENRQATPVLTVHASPRVIEILRDRNQRPQIVATVEVPSRLDLIQPSDR